MFAPYFAGISTESCGVYGGKWCPNPQNCAALQDCVASYIGAADAVNETGAYITFLKSSSNITNPTDAFSCGRAREYFGFEAKFPNDDQICEDVNELRNTRDLEILEGFFSASGGPGNGGGTGGPRVQLKPPDPRKCNL
jgi:hypothetical protein